MRKLFLLLNLCFFIAVSSFAQDKQPVSMTFDTEHIDLGKVKRGEKRTFDYTFENTGKETLKISIVSGCDCTTLDWSRRPIKPGETGTINVIFDSTEKEASETVDVDIYLENLDPKTGEQYLKIIDYTFELIQ
jgi:peptidoglycan-associated lipoprotein